MFENYTLATAAQQYAEQTADANSGLALWVNGAYTLYSNLPTALPRAVQMQAVSNGADHWQLAHCAGYWYLLLSQPLDIPGVQADILCSYDVTSVFATRNAQLRAWLAASTALLALGGAAAVLFSRLVTRPLTTLQSASEKIAAGQYTERTQVQTNDEIGVLSRSFDAMAAAVETKIGEMDETLQSQKDFIAAFTHEVKTPMTAMLGYADLMRAAPDDADLQRESANYIYHETRRLEELSRRLLALMGLDAADRLTPEPVSDRSLLNQVVRSLPQGSTPVPRIIACDCAVQVDRALWVDMLRNLTINAQRACKGIAGGGHHTALPAAGEHRRFHSGRYRLRHPCRRPAPRDRSLLYGGQVPQPCRWWQRHRAGAVYPNRPGPRHPITNRQHRGCGYDRDRIRTYPWP